MADLKNDIDKYLKGKLTPQEMNALERKALSDPFLEDALEGAGELSPDMLAEDLQRLELSLTQRIQNKETKVVSLWVWSARIAAGLSLLAVASWLVFSLSNSDRDNDLAVKEETQTLPAEQKKPAQQEITTDPIQADAANQNAVTESNEQQRAATLSEAAPEVPKASAPAPVISNEEERDRSQDEAADAVNEPAAEVASKQPSVEKALQGATPGVAVIRDEDVERARKAGPASKRSALPAESKSRRKDVTTPAASGYGYTNERQTSIDSTSFKTMEGRLANARKVKGQVVDDSGTGLPGVNVLIKGTNIGAVTDENGSYQIALTQPQGGLVYSYIGYSSKEVELREGESEVNVQLNEDASQLSEVVVVGYGTERSSDDDLPSTVEFAAPTGGRKAFKQYLEKNLIYPEQALTNNIEGKVTVQFNVETSGELSGFKIIRGIGNGCDEEVIRLIKTGPKWSATKKNDDVVRDRVKVRMRFALPKKKK